MDREILFRGKRVDNSEWVYGSLISFADGQKSILPSKSSAYFPVGSSMMSSNSCFDVDSYTVGQYTGMTDKNGVKIFEGDILAFYSDYHEKEIIDGVVKYGEFNCTCCDGVYGWYIDGGDIRKLGDTNTRLYVVGNIHDNPELLGE